MPGASNQTAPQGRAEAPDPLPAAAGRSVLVGLIGRGIAGSLSPMMHEGEGARLGLRYLYKLIDLDALQLDSSALPDLLLAAEHFGFAGLNVTHPFKQAILPLLDEVAPDAAAIGAVNTIVLRGGQRIGYNTDGWGFAESFRHEMAGAQRRLVVQCGAGGAGAAVARALLEVGATRLALHDIRSERAARLAADLCGAFGAGRALAVPELAAAMEAADGLVNATPLGMDKYPGLPFPVACLQPRHWVADIVYFPAETRLLAAARRLGCRTIGGAGMAAYQAAKAFELFTGLQADGAAMAARLIASTLSPAPGSGAELT